MQDSGRATESTAETAVYRLLAAPGMGAAVLARVLTAWREEPALLESFRQGPTSGFWDRWGLPARVVRALQQEDADGSGWPAAEQAVRRARQAEIELLSLLDPAYAALAGIRGLPSVLFTRGNQDLLWGRGVAVVQSQDAPEEALAWGAAVAAGLAAAGVLLIGSQSRDGYRRVCAAAKRHGSPLAIVLDRPLHDTPSEGPRAEPVATARLWDPEFRPERELIVSPYRPGEAWTARHARGRDALVVDLASVVIAGGVRAGGTMASLCAPAAAAARRLFRAPHCRVELPGQELPSDPAEAAAAVAGALREDEGVAGAPVPQPGWLQRRWESECGRFEQELQEEGEGVWMERRRGAGEGGGWSRELPAHVIAAILLPGLPGESDEALLLVGRADGAVGPGEEEAPVLLLAPRGPVETLAGLRHYLARCRSQWRTALRR